MDDSISTMTSYEEQLRSVVDAELIPYVRVVRENYQRALGLVVTALETHHRLLKSVKKSKETQRDYQEESQRAGDVFRAALVFSHSALEDFLRTLARCLLPLQGEAALNEVPLVGLDSGRPEKFFLGKLVRHKGKLVDDLLRESVADFLERSNFNSVQEIHSLLTRLGIQPQGKDTECYADLTDLIERRHQIVHRGDRAQSLDHSIQDLDGTRVLMWITTSQDFTWNVLKRLGVKAGVSDAIEPLLKEPIKISSSYYGEVEKREKRKKRSTKASSAIEADSPLKSGIRTLSNNIFRVGI